MTSGGPFMFQEVNTHFSVAGQLNPIDMDWIASAGFKSVICNRPDFEGGPQQPESSVLQKKAEEAGLVYEAVPIEPSALRSQDVARFATLMSELPAPVLAFCRTGNRSRALYMAAIALSESAGRPPDAATD